MEDANKQAEYHFEHEDLEVHITVLDDGTVSVLTNLPQSSEDFEDPDANAEDVAFTIGYYRAIGYLLQNLAACGVDLSGEGVQSAFALTIDQIDDEGEAMGYGYDDEEP